MRAMIHRLTATPQFAASTVACGDPTAALALWDARGRDPAQLCPACWGIRPACTCGPLTPVCPACRQWNAQHRGRPPRLPALKTEKAFQAAVQQQAQTAGFLVYHTYDARKSPAGYPDLTLVHPGRGLAIFAELKMPGKGPTAAQQQWLEALGQVREVQAHLWRPSDWETIVEVLR